MPRLPPSNSMKITKRDAIRIAIAYGEVFDYPLSEDEVRIWAPYVMLSKHLIGIRSAKRLLSIRRKRSAWSEEKWIRARRVANLLKLIPTIALIGVTGGLTRSNAKEEDDIDFLIITTPKTLWVSRALSTILLDLFGLRRRPRDTKLRNLICLNMFMSEEGLRVPPNERDLFTAHEVLLMTPLWERDGIYKSFLYANAWVKKFLPNAWGEKVKSKKWKVKNGKSYKAFSILEPIARFIQLRYMRKRQTSEVVSDTVIRFHPRDARVWIKHKLGVRLKRYNIPLDKIFYGR